MYSYISPQVWADFERRFPLAAAYLRSESLHGELNALLNMTNPTAYQRRRIEELQAITESNRKIMSGEWPE